MWAFLPCKGQWRTNIDPYLPHETLYCALMTKSLRVNTANHNKIYVAISECLEEHSIFDFCSEFFIILANWLLNKIKYSKTFQFKLNIFLRLHT